MNMCNNTPPLHIKSTSVPAFASGVPRTYLTFITMPQYESIRAHIHTRTLTDKDKWIDEERRRWAALFNIPMHTDSPPGFPPKTLPIMRALAAIQHTEAASSSSSSSSWSSSSSSSSSHQQPQLTAALDALWHEFFVLHTQTHEPAHLSRILSSSASSLDAEAILQAATTDQVKKRLTQNTNEAFASGAFGLPWMVCTNEAGETEAFWGVDHMGQVAAFLGLEKPGSGGWKAML
jgi:2-hydroxychromene-2-carboxylate isomerase